MPGSAAGGGRKMVDTFMLKVTKLNEISRAGTCSYLKIDMMEKAILSIF